jgi:hypothetical protein
VEFMLYREFDPSGSKCDTPDDGSKTGANVQRDLSRLGDGVPWCVGVRGSGVEHDRDHDHDREPGPDRESDSDSEPDLDPDPEPDRESDSDSDSDLDPDSVLDLDLDP